jgi:hypothetical protein
MAGAEWYKRAASMRRRPFVFAVARAIPQQQRALCEPVLAEAWLLYPCLRLRPVASSFNISRDSHHSYPLMLRPMHVLAHL